MQREPIVPGETIHNEALPARLQASADCQRLCAAHLRLGYEQRLLTVADPAHKCLAEKVARGINSGPF